MSEKIVENVINLMHEASKIMPSEGFNNRSIETKSKNSLVTEIDKNIEKALVAGLSKIIPQSGFIAEEGTSNKRSDQYNWIIDPLDGTTNFIHGVPHYCISIGLLHQKELIQGYIYEFNQKEMYVAEKGSGAFLNGHEIHCSKTNKLEDALLATGFPYYDFEQMDAYLALLKSLMEDTRGLRRLGSAAYDLALVARGVFDGFFEYGLHPWDVAAGILMVEEAGGSVADFKDHQNQLFGKEIVATNGFIQKDLLKKIQAHFV